jgi:hypothetical protein
MKPTLIHSKILNETIYLSETEIQGKICYSEKEIKFLRACEKNMTPEVYAEYLRKIHLVKKTFPGSKIEDVKRSAPESEVATSVPVRVNEFPPTVEQNDLPGVEEKDQKSPWEL